MCNEKKLSIDNTKFHITVFLFYTLREMHRNNILNETHNDLTQPTSISESMFRFLFPGKTQKMKSFLSKLQLPIVKNFP